MKKILGLDLGVSSIGWALVLENDDIREILGLGCRIIPLNPDDKQEFSTGNSISKNKKRTTDRTQRKGYDRYQLRRKNLTQELLEKNMFDESILNLKPLELWGLRAKAVNDKITLKELGRVLYHLNQKRGYKSGRSEANLDKKDTEYVSEVKNRHQEIKELGITIGQKFYNELLKNEHYRIKKQVFPREAYIEEFDAIMREQQTHYKEILTDKFILKLRNEIIYFQRKLKSQKGLVNVCDFEGFWFKTEEGKEIFVGPRVAQRSSPLFQVCKIWETINHISLRSKKGEEFKIPLEKKIELFKYLDTHEKLSQAELFKILNLKKDDYYGNKLIAKGIQGNITKSLILKSVKNLIFDESLLNFNLEIQEKTDEEIYLTDMKTGEIIDSNIKKVISDNFEKQPFYQLWHTIYSISEKNECIKVLMNKFNIEQTSAEKLASLDLTNYAYGNKSSKAIRKILPYLMDGFVYSDASSFAGYNHSNSLTKDENLKRKLIDKIPLLSKNSLRQPIVEKILNQLINIVNAIIEKYGKPDEIRIELARELKQSREERNETYKNINKIENENEIIRKRLQNDYGIRPTRNNIIKWRLFHEINNEESIVNANCIYCGKQFGITEALKGSNVDVEHIIPKSLLFDDSQSNKTLSHRNCNEEKGKDTAFDYMQKKGEELFNQYLNRVEDLYKRRIIGKSKRDKLLTPINKIPQDFIERQLRETQYISRKAKEILQQVCRNVWSTSGNITAHLRNLWGWDDVLMNLQLPKFRELGLTEFIEWETKDGQKHKKEIIKDWTKRDDHRHHAIDALTIACTKQGFIQRINTLSSKHTRSEMFAELSKQNTEFKEKLNLLDSYLILQKPFTTKQVADKAEEILISFKSGKKVATIGTRKIKKRGKKVEVQKNIIIPRGALSEEQVYGKIRIIQRKKPIKYLFENSSLIYKPYIKKLVEERISKFEGDIKKSISSLKKEPIYLDEEMKIKLEYGSCFKEEIVIKYPLESIKAKDAEFIVDKKIKELVMERLSKFGNKEKGAFDEPLYFDEKSKIQIKSVRMLTGLSAVEPIKKDENGNDIGFVKPGNNHHIAFYSDENGKTIEHICTFWNAVERKKFGLPVIINNPNEIWESILNEENDDKYSNSFLEKLPKNNWTFKYSMQQNEMFIIGLSPEILIKALKEKNKKLLSNYIFRVQKIASNDYWLRLHSETKVGDTTNVKESKRYYRIKSIGAFEKLNPQKIRINKLGEIIID
ncbi:MAG: type II CRISPR RNA-guided endonuclease Cas9 [Ignavibacteria bacterium]|nr:type II CRISPR RNA-guided endonuclease Cas9 [Ignavibacteria bacterium]